MNVSDMIDSIDIVDFISQFVDLTEQGGEWWGISPFTYPPENTPSFSVRRESNRFYDFSSGVGGSVVTFVKYLKKCSTKDAISFLMNYLGVSDSSELRIPQKLSASVVCRKFQKTRKQDKKSKGVVLKGTCMDQYESRPDKLQAWVDEGISMESLEKFCVKYDPFSDRLVYPIRNLSGEIVNIGGRTLDPDWKEKQLRKYTYFYGWGTMDVLYGLYENLSDILEKREVIVFEGCKSVLLANTWGIRNTAALLTSHCNPNQMKVLARLGCRVVFALDKEIRIREDHNIQRLKNYVDVEYIWDCNDLLDEKDAPVDKGRDVFMELYSNRLRYR